MIFIEKVRVDQIVFYHLGAGGQRVCHVREVPLQLPVPLSADCSISLLSDPKFQFEFPNNADHESLLQSYNDRIQLKKRRERLLPPIPGWSPTGTVNRKFLFLFDLYEKNKIELFEILFFVFF